MIDVEHFPVPKKYEGLKNFLVATGVLQDVTHYDESVVDIWSRIVLKLIERNDPTWETMVPAQVIKVIKEKKLFGHP